MPHEYRITWLSNMRESFPEVLTPLQFEEIFGKTLSPKCTHLVKSLNLRYRFLTIDERDKHILEVINFLKKDITPSGSSRKPLWEKGWGQNLDDFIKSDLDLSELLPHYYRRGKSIMRLQGSFILPEDPLFEAKFLKIIHLILSEEYLDKYSNIYEMGAGPCHNIAGFAENLVGKFFYSTDWVAPSVEIAKLLESNKNKLNFSTHTFHSSIFNFFEPDQTLRFAPNSVALTFGSLEQIGQKFDALLEYFLSQDSVEFIHIEPFLECYERDSLFDQLGFLYSQKRGYLEGYLDRLRALRLEGLIEIKSIQKILGSAFHDGWTMVTWKKLK
jgi:hypothetical protein